MVATLEKSRTTRQCEVCGRGFCTRPSAVARGEGRFCSTECTWSWKRSAYRKMHHDAREARFKAITPLTINGKYAAVPLTRGKWATINIEDWPIVGRFLWTAMKGGKTWYANSRFGLMHVFILKTTLIDHKNRNGLDNRRENLRACSNSQNSWNQPGRGGSSAFKGVSRSKRDAHLPRPWAAKLRIGNGRTLRLGSFATEKEAARAHDDAARKYHGEFAYLNFPTGGDE